MVRRLNPRNLENIYISPRLAAAAASSLHIYIKNKKILLILYFYANFFVCVRVSFVMVVKLGSHAR